MYKFYNNSIKFGDLKLVNFLKYYNSKADKNCSYRYLQIKFIYIQINS